MPCRRRAGAASARSRRLYWLRTYPFADAIPRNSLVRAAEDDTGAGGNWSLNGYAICADPLPGYELVVYTSPAGSPPSQPFQGPACPTGKRVVGVGAYTTPLAHQLSLKALIPQSQAVSVFVMEDHDGTPDGWSTRSQAICADV